MHCPSCNALVAQPANFCPVCGASMAAPATPAPDNVVPIRPAQVVPEAPGSVHVDEQSGTYSPGVPPTAPPAAPAPPHVVASVPVERDVRGLPIEPGMGSFFDDSPSMNWMGDLGPEDTGEPRFVGTLLAVASIGMFILSGVVYGIQLSRGAAGADAGGFLLLSAILWVIYLSLPDAQQHEPLIALHERISRSIDRRIIPLRQRTEVQLTMRRERDRYRAMRDERSRRVADLGEAAYRHFRTGELDESLAGQARRVMAIEQQMLMQDARLHDMRTAASDAEHSRPDATEPAAVSAVELSSARPAKSRKRSRRRRPRH